MKALEASSVMMRTALCRRAVSTTPTHLLQRGLRLRWYNAQGHKTYFQDDPPPPPPPASSSGSRGWKIVRTLLFGTFCAATGAGALSWSLASAVDQLEEEVEQEERNLTSLVHDAHIAAMAKQVPAIKGEYTSIVMNNARAGFSVTPTAVSHFVQLHSNLPCEDTMSSGTYTYHTEHFNDPSRDWSEWSIFDGHAGPRTANLLQDVLPWHVGGELWEKGCMDRPYTPNDTHIIDTIKRAFVGFDEHMFEEVGRRLTAGPGMGAGSTADMVSMLSNVMSGSCALYTVFDPKNSVVRVANVGDSRAVLGRWDSQKSKYVAQVLSIDQTGFNKSEVDRITAEHPGEDVIDPKSGRVHGIMVSRAFGDARWKWPQELNNRAHEFFWGPKPRPDNKILTPPYLTAEPDVMEAKIESGDHPDFLIMASDGYWDKVSNEDAVTCVQMWLDKHKAADFLEADAFNQVRPAAYPFSTPIESHDETSKDGATPFLASAKTTKDQDYFYDKDMGSLQWRTGPEHFVVKDEHCGVHLLRNALGGKRQDLLEGVLSVQPPLSRNVRDDISINVIFFGVDAKEFSEEIAQASQKTRAQERSAALAASLK